MEPSIERRITFNPHDGVPEIRDLGYSVPMTLALLRHGMSESEVLANLSGLEPEDIAAAQQYAAQARVVELWEYHGIGLILLVPSGVRYTNQTGGTACYFPQAEGVFVPLPDDTNVVLGWLTDYFTGPKWQGACWHGIDEETADYLDEEIGDCWA